MKETAPMTSAQQLQDLLGLRKAPVAVTFCAAPPAGVRRVEAGAPSSCTYWKLAAEGQTFYTEPADHTGCPIGAYTHGIEMSAQTGQELQTVVTTMIGLGYIRMEEVPDIPRRTETFGVAVYAPLAQATGDPDVVIVAGNARQVMLLTEAAQAAGAGAGSGLMGRPTCAAIPQAQRTGQGVGSLGCIGNRVYAGLTDDELYFVLPGNQVRAVTEKLAGIVNANVELERYHKAKLA
jgi:uncharacterized protein (DUF169 family)